MKPAPFAYADPETIDEALALLADAGEDAAVIAGGQSLIPLLNLRLATPELVVDPRRIPQLGAIAFGQDGLRVGAMARAVDLEEHAEVDRIAGLAEALAQIGHVQIRARTTIGGSVAHADPAAELPALLVAAGGEIVLSSAAAGERVVPAEEFFTGPLMTARRPAELLTEVWFPAHPGSMTVLEVVKRPGDFAIAGVVAGFATVDGLVSDPRIALFGVAGRPVRMRSAEMVLVGKPPEPDWFAAAADRVRADLTPTADSHGSADYRRDVSGTLVERALASLT